MDMSVNKFSLIFFIKNLFFLPPPQTKTFGNLFLISDKFKDKDVPINLAVKSVKVVVPSSRLSPRAKEISKL